MLVSFVLTFETSLYRVIQNSYENVHICQSRDLLFPLLIFFSYFTTESCIMLLTFILMNLKTTCYLFEPEFLLSNCLCSQVTILYQTASQISFQILICLRKSSNHTLVSILTICSQNHPATENTRYHHSSCRSFFTANRKQV